MKDFANRKKVKKNISKNRQTFGSRKPDANTISKKTIAYLLLTSVCFVVVAFFYFKTDVVSIKPKNLGNSVTIDIPTSLINQGILIESQSSDQKPLLCEYFVQVGAYGNKKYALEAENMLKSEIQNISINGVYSSSNPGRLLHSVISGPYENRSAASNAKEKITKKGFDPRLRTSCEQT